MAQQEKITVLCTVYNGEKYFDRAIPSILAQTYRNFDFIIINDGSEDNTLKMLNEIALKDSRIKIYSPGRLGRGEALNYGINVADTELIAFQDFDDRSYPQRLEKQVNYMQKNLRVAWSCGYSYAINEFRNTSILRKLPLEHDSIVKEMVYQIPWDMTLVICKKEAIIETIKKGFVNFDQEDLIMVTQLIKNGWQTGNITSVLGEHIEHQNSFFNANNSYLERQKSLRKVQRELIGELSLSKWNYIYIHFRHIYAYLPNSLKRLIIRINTLIRSN